MSVGKHIRKRAKYIRMIKPKELPYDKTSPSSIEAYSQKLLNKSLKDVIGETVDAYKGKGKLGQLVEELFFQYKPNSNAGPDFPEAGVEVKTTPLKRLKNNELTSKERLVFNIINFEEEHRNDFFTSSFWLKNQLLLLMFFLHEKEKLDIDYIFKIIKLYKFPEKDLIIIKQDWEKIIAKIRAGKAHELSEGDTLYLGACPKGATSASLRKQPFSETMAMQRAYSLKSKYLNYIVKKSLGGAAVKDIDALREKTFEEIIIEKFKPFYGLSITEISDKLGYKISNAKSSIYLLTKEILEVKGKYIEEFEKADIQLKTIRLEKSGALKESMSFPQIQFTKIVKENFLESAWYEMITKRFFFVIFQKNETEELILKKVMFWTMQYEDIQLAQEFWLDTKKKVVNGEFENFLKLADDKKFHVRPKAANAADLMATDGFGLQKKKSYWFNASYVKEIIA